MERHPKADTDPSPSRDGKLLRKDIWAVAPQNLQHAQIQNSPPAAKPIENILIEETNTGVQFAYK